MTAVPYFSKILYYYLHQSSHNLAVHLKPQDPLTYRPTKMHYKITTFIHKNNVSVSLGSISKVNALQRLHCD